MVNDLIRRTRAVDLLCLAAICLLSSSVYVRGLGFYSDDWGILQGFDGMRARGHLDFGRLFSDFGPRPLQGLYLGALYLAFGHAPLGYHVVNALVVAASVCLLYIVLSDLGLGRAVAFGSSSVTAVLPQLSTVRVWMTAYQIPLSMLCALASIACQLRYCRSRQVRWLVLATTAGLLSVAAYEIFAPFIVLFAVASAATRSWASRSSRLSVASAWPDLIPAVALVIAGIIKGAISNRLESRPSAYVQEAATFFRTDYDWRTEYGLNLFAAVDVHFRATFAIWRGELFEVSRHTPDWPMLPASTAAAALVFWRLSIGSDEARLKQSLLLGLAAWVFGHGVFLVTQDIMFSPTGIANRVLVAPAIGVALILVCAWAWAVRLLPARARQLFFAAGISAVVFIGIGQTARAASYWVRAAEDQKQFIALAKADLRSVPAGATIIVDGLCPYDGPAIVFETYWDTRGALSIALGREVEADVISPRMRLMPKGLSTSIYNFASFYPFGPKLYAYDPRVHRLTPLPDLATAMAYFRRSPRQPMRCPRGLVGQGVLI